MSNSQLRQGRYSESGRIYHVITRLHGSDNLFEDFSRARQCCAALHDIEDGGDIKTLCWVLMPDHLHLLVQLRDGENLGHCIKKLKGKSARLLNRRLGRTGSLWQKSFYDRALRHDDDLLIVARYIVANPIRAGLVKKVGDYPFWNAVWL